MINVERLKEIIKTMNIPENKRDITDKDNLSWLARNLGRNNMRHPNYYEAIRLAKELKKRDNNGIS